MFLYACGISRVHQEFELFEQIWENCANFKEKCCRFPSRRRKLRSQIRNVSLALFSSLFPHRLFSSFYIVFFSVVKTCGSACRFVSWGNIQKVNLGKEKKIEAMSLGMPVFHNGGKRYLNFLLNMKQWGNGGADSKQQGRSINLGGEELNFRGGRVFPFSWENLLWKKKQSSNNLKLLCNT